jgi:hypothetical protein
MGRVLISKRNQEKQCHCCPETNKQYLSDQETKKTVFFWSENQVNSAFWSLSSFNGFSKLWKKLFLVFSQDVCPVAVALVCSRA